MTLTPAYGRDYKSRKEVQAALDADLDFIIADMFSEFSGKPVNKSQLIETGVRSVTIRWKSLRSVAVFQVKP